MFYYGKYPSKDLDHINGNKSDNCIDNLREVTHRVNIQNEKKARVNSKTGLLGVSPQGDKYQAQIITNGKVKYLGIYETPEEGHQVYLSAKRELHEGNTL